MLEEGVRGITLHRVAWCKVFGSLCMDSFYLIVLGVAALFLIIMLIFMGWMISRKQDQITTPSPSGAGMASMCPDYWIINTDDTCQIPINDASANVGSIYTAAGSLSSDFTSNSSPIYDAGNIKTRESDWSNYMNKGLDPVCAKKMWANRWNIYWDGISNANYC